MFKNFSLKHKIIVAVLAPASIAIYFLALNVNLKINDYNMAQYMQDNIDMMATNQEFITNLQKERGLSSIFLGSTNSNYEIVKQQIMKTDEALKIFKEKVYKSHVDSNAIKLAVENVDTLPKLRSSVEAKSLTRELVLKEYTKIIKAVSGLNNAALRDKTSFGLGKQMSNIAILLEAQENLALMRGTVSGIFASNKPIDSTTTNELIKIHAGILANLNSPALILTKEANNNLKKLSIS